MTRFQIRERAIARLARKADRCDMFRFDQADEPTPIEDGELEQELAEEAEQIRTVARYYKWSRGYTARTLREEAEKTRRHANAERSLFDSARSGRMPQGAHEGGSSEGHDDAEQATSGTYNRWSYANELD